MSCCPGREETLQGCPCPYPGGDAQRSGAAEAVQGAGYVGLSPDPRARLKIWENRPEPRNKRDPLRGVLRSHKPQLRLAASGDLLIHLNFLMFLHRLAEEARTNAFENKSKTIKPEHTVAAAKVILKRSRG